VTLVDSNVLIDLLGNDRNWLDWSIEAMDRSAAQGPLLINQVVFAELAVRSTSEEALIRDLANLAVSIERIPVSALYLAGKVFARYRATGGTRASLLPDFFVGAHAQIARMTILTRDARRYRTHFPAVPLITP
jgi:hypothetical protein